MIQFLQRLVLVVVPLLIVVIGVNFFGDAANLFSRDYEMRMAEEILKGNHVTNVYNYNERVLQRYLVRGFSGCPEVVAIGSSRIMLVSSDYFSPKTFFNNAISGATIEDMIAVIQMYDQRHCLPKKILIGLDPWMLNSNNGLEKWKTLNDEYQSFFGGSTHPESKSLPGMSGKAKQFYISNVKYKELVSPSYFQNSLSNLMSGKGRQTATQTKINTYFTKLADGSICYDLDVRNASSMKIEQGISKVISQGLYGIERFGELDASLQNRLAALVNYFISRKVEVVLFLAPYHPSLYRFISDNNKYQRVLESENYFKQFAIEKGLRIIGSYDPVQIGLDSKCFYDGIHLRETGLNRMMNLFRSCDLNPSKLIVCKN